MKHIGLILILFIPLLLKSQEINRNKIDSVISSCFSKTLLDMEFNGNALLNTSNYLLYRQIDNMGGRVNSQCKIINILKSITSSFYCDSLFIAKQLNDTNTYYWENNNLKELTIISENNLVSYPEEITIISRPLLTADLNFMIVAFTIAREDILIRGSIKIYKKLGNEYKLLKEVCKWVH